MKMVVVLGFLFAVSAAWAAPREASKSAFAGELGAIVQRDSGGRITGTKFSVWAPNAESVDVIGTFNDWNPRRGRMEQSEQGGIWTAEISSAKPGDEYLFLINGSLKRKDPRARQVTASDGNCVIYDVDAFDWGAAKEFKSSAAMKDLVIYQLHIGTFHDPSPGDGEPGTFKDAIAKLDHLKEMGVNCVLVLPVNEFHGRHSWGYNPSDLFAIETTYGGPDGFKEFIKACHERGIAVHVDIVHNHYGPQDLSLVQFDGAGGGDNKNGIYFYEDTERGETPWGPRPNFGTSEVRDYIRDNVRMWFQEYRVDGLRWDSTINIRAVNNGRTPNPEGESLLHNISKMIEREFPGKISIAEDSVGDPRFHGSWQYDFHHAGNWSQGLVPQLVSNAGPFLSVKDIGNRINSELGFGRVIYSENHDEVGKLNGKRRILVDADENDPHSLTARRKAALAAVVTLTSPGVPLIFMGQELLETAQFHDSNPLDWGLGELSFGKFQFYRDLVRLRRNLDGASPALTGLKTRIAKADEGDKFLAWRRYVPGRSEEDLYVLANFSDEPIKDRKVFFPQSGEWKMLLNSDDPKYGPGLTGVATETLRTDSSHSLTVNLAPWSAQIFGLQKLEPTEADLSALKEEWEAAHGAEEDVVAAPPVPEVVEEVEEEIPAEPEIVPLKTDAGRFVLLVPFSQPRPWDATNADFQMGLMDDYLWRYELGFPPGTPFTSFLIMNAKTGALYGGNGIPTQHMPAAGTAVESGAPITVQGPLDGDYEVSFNEKDLRFRFERKAKTDFRRFAVMGNFNGWKPSADLMTMSGDYSWQADIDFDGRAGTEFVFVADNTFEKQWGDDAGQFESAPAEGTAVDLGAPIRIASELKGPHRITFNEVSGAYSIAPLSNAESEPLPPVPEVKPVEEIRRLSKAAP